MTNFYKIGRFLLIVVGLYLLIILGATVLSHSAPHARFFADGPTDRPWVIAHQGGDGERPSNTMVAFRHAAQLGVDVLEMDIHSTRDGVLVTIHDVTVDRTTDGTGAVSEMTLAEVKALDAGYHWPTLSEHAQAGTFPYRGQGVTIATLAEIFEAFPTMRMNIELKQVEPSIADSFCGLIRTYGMQDLVLVASFRMQAMQEFRVACPEVATSATEDEVRQAFYGYLGRVPLPRQPEYTAVQVPEYGGGFHILTPRYMRTAHKRNLHVDAWTINHPDEIARMRVLEVDGIITDFPTRVIEQ